MRVELPEGYVPPQPTHPHYGYLTPQEHADLEAAEREQVGIVPGVETPAEMAEMGEMGEMGEVGEVGPEVSLEVGPHGGPMEPVAPSEHGSMEEAAPTRHTGWVPPPPSPDPPPDVAAAAGGRGSSSSWTSADGQRFRWDARAQQWVTEPAER